mmetsp:Transcript_50425/g.117696  ORF Transcript_50425/g.117696 Transcript_50425/m.117696 type:complete len:216 (+) Transcript_50425:64-711(+)
MVLVDVSGSVGPAPAHPRAGSPDRRLVRPGRLWNHVENERSKLQTHTAVVAHLRSMLGYDFPRAFQHCSEWAEDVNFVTFQKRCGTAPGRSARPVAESSALGLSSSAPSLAATTTTSSLFTIPQRGSARTPGTASGGRAHRNRPVVQSAATVESGSPTSATGRSLTPSASAPGLGMASVKPGSPSSGGVDESPRSVESPALPAARRVEPEEMLPF